MYRNSNNNNNSSTNTNSTNGTANIAPNENVNNENGIVINIGSDIVVDTQHEPLLQSDSRAETSINMEQPNVANGSAERSTSNVMQRNIISFINRTRTQLGRQVSMPGGSSSSSNNMNSPTAEVSHDASSIAAPTTIATDNDNANALNGASSSPHSRYLRYMLSFSTNPPAETLRSLIRPGSFRYTQLNINDNVPTGSTVAAAAGLADTNRLQQQQQQTTARGMSIDVLRPFSRTLRSESAPVGISSNNAVSTQLQNAHSSQSFAVTTPVVAVPTATSSSSTAANGANNILIRHSVSSLNSPANTPAAGANRNAATQQPGADLDDDNDFSNFIVKFLSHFVRYLPFICILLIKYVHDHLFGIFDIAILQVAMYNVDKSLRKQVAKLSQKNMLILLRDFSLISLFVCYRMLISSAAIDPFGLLIMPPTEQVTINVASITSGPTATEATDSNTVTVTKMLNKYLSQMVVRSETTQKAGSVTIAEVMTLGVLLYYIAVNDLILKLLTILVKITITMMPTNVIRQKARARMYVLIEYVSQFYRSLVPIHQWLLYLFNGYTGLEVISGVCFTSLYLGAKGFEFIERGKSVKGALIKFMHNMESERQATKDEVDAAGLLCPICHDNFNAPIVLECRHIFCEDCVNTWFKREQTCPMCRAKVSDDPTWQDGATTFFYQLY